MIIAKIKSILLKIVYFFGCLISVAMILTVLLQIVARFALKVSIPWTEELSRLLFIGMVSFGAAVASMKKSHIVVDVFSSKIPEKYKIYYSTVITLLVILIAFVFFDGSLHMIPKAAKTSYSTMPIVKNSWPYYFTSFSFGMIALDQTVTLFTDIVSAFKKK